MHSLPLVLLLCALAARVPGQETPRSHEALAKEVTRLATVEMDRQKIPGMSLAVVHKGRIVVKLGLGLADMENNVPTTIHTRFRTASIAKPMTAVAVMQLLEKGRIGLDDPIHSHCPEYPRKKWDPTIRQLMGHLGGVRHYMRPGEAAGKSFFPTIAASIRNFSEEALLHEPGSRFRYTTYGFTLLGRTVETASGIPYENYMQEKIWNASGMQDTCIDSHFLLVPHRARGYARLSRARHAGLPVALQKRTQVGQVINAELHDTSMKIPGGGLLSTAPDLVRLGLAMTSNRLISAEKKRVMLTPQVTSDGKKTGMGLGWGLSMQDGEFSFHHGGGQAGTSCFLRIVPGREIVVACMTNLEGAKIPPLVSRIVDATAGQ